MIGPKSPLYEQKQKYIADQNACTYQTKEVTIFTVLMCFNFSLDTCLVKKCSW